MSRYLATSPSLVSTAPPSLPSSLPLGADGPAASSSTSSSSSVSSSSSSSSSAVVLQPANALEYSLGSSPALPSLPSRITVQNVVCTCSLGTELELREIAVRARNAEYNPKKFGACVMRLRDPKSTALVFHSGKVIVTGAKTVEAAHTAAKKHARIIQKVGIPVQFKQFQVQNLVACADVRVPIPLEEFQLQFPNNTHFEPEIFPGLVFRLQQPHCACVLFCSGKVVVTGVKSMGDAEAALR
eukprot:RCo010407